MKRDVFRSRQPTVEAALQFQLERATGADTPPAAGPSGGSRRVNEHGDPEIAELREGWQMLCSALRSQDLAMAGAIPEATVPEQLGTRDVQSSAMKSAAQVAIPLSLQQRVRERVHGRIPVAARNRAWLMALAILPVLAGGAWGLSTLAFRGDKPVEPIAEGGAAAETRKPATAVASVPVDRHPTPAWEITPRSGGTPQPVVERQRGDGTDNQAEAADWDAWDDPQDRMLEGELVALSFAAENLEREWQSESTFLRWIAGRLHALGDELASTLL